MVHLKITFLKREIIWTKPSFVGFHVKFVGYVEWMDDSKSIYLGNACCWPSIHLKLVVWSSRYKFKDINEHPLPGSWKWPCLEALKSDLFQPMILEGPLPLRSTQLVKNAHEMPSWNKKMSSYWLMATRNPVNSPVEVGSLSHDLQGFSTSLVVGIGISEPSTVFHHILSILILGWSKRCM